MTVKLGRDRGGDLGGEFVQPHDLVRERLSRFDHMFDTSPPTKPPTSSASSRVVYPGHAIYGAPKAAIERWVRCVRAEREDRGKGPWVSAIRPGFVDTPAARREAELPPETHPGVPGIAEAVQTGNVLEAVESANLIWGAIPEQTKAKPVLLFGEPVGVTTQR